MTDHWTDALFVDDPAKSLATALDPVSYKESRRIIAIMQKN